MSIWTHGHGWSKGEWAGVPFVNNQPEFTNKTTEVKTTGDITKFGNEVVKHSLIPNEEGNFDIIPTISQPNAIRADLPA